MCALTCKQRDNAHFLQKKKSILKWRYKKNENFKVCFGNEKHKFKNINLSHFIQLVYFWGIYKLIGHVTFQKKTIQKTTLKKALYKLKIVKMVLPERISLCVATNIQLVAAPVPPPQRLLMKQFAFSLFSKRFHFFFDLEKMRTSKVFGNEKAQNLKILICRTFKQA